jgi:hypothetical protein
MPRKRASSGVRSRAAREARAKRQARYKPTAIPADVDLTSPAHTLSARDLYLREKARRARVAQDPDHPMSQARRQYEALLAAEAEAGRGGRPKKVVAAKNAARKAMLERANADEED